MQKAHGFTVDQESPPEQSINGAELVTNGLLLDASRLPIVLRKNNDKMPKSNSTRGWHIKAIPGAK